MQQQEIDNIKTGSDDEDQFDHRFPFQTKAGWPARLLGVLEGTRPQLVVALKDPMFKTESVSTYALDGKEFDDEFSLVNLPYFNEDGTRTLKCSDHVHSFTRDLEPMDLEKSSNPFHYDFCSMGSQLVCGWYVMHQGYDSPDHQRPLTHVDLVNERSGQRIRVNLMNPKLSK